MNKEIRDLSLEMKEMSAFNDALHRVQAVIEFDMNGDIIDVNENFLDILGYTLEAVRGKHHRMLCDPAYAASADYTKFWARLANGNFERGEYKRITADGEVVWLNASYNPVLNSEGVPYKVIKFATDITASRNAAAEVHSKMAALDKSQAMIEFDLNGNVRLTKTFSRRLATGSMKLLVSIIVCSAIRTMPRAVSTLLFGTNCAAAFSTLAAIAA